MPDGTILVRRRSLGDVVLLGAITSRVPGPVTVVTEPRFMRLAGRLQGVDRVVAWGEEVPEGRVIDLEVSLRTLWRFPLARKVRKHALARRLRLWGYGTGRPPVVELYARAAQVDPAPAPWIRIPNRGRDTLALVPGGSTTLKAPRAEHLVALAHRWPGPVAVLGGPGEEALVEGLAAQIPGARAVAEQGFARTLDVLATTAVVVGGDTGLMHLAAACGRRTVVLAGPTHPDDGFLRWPSSIVVQRELPCRPCTLHRGRTCRLGDRRCLDLDPAEIWRATEAAGALGAADR